MIEQPLIACTGFPRCIQTAAKGWNDSQTHTEIFYYDQEAQKFLKAGSAPVVSINFIMGMKSLMHNFIACKSLH